MGAKQSYLAEFARLYRKSHWKKYGLSVRIAMNDEAQRLMHWL